MMSKAELEVLAEKYEAKAERSYQNYQDTGIARYDRERRNAEELSSAMRMAAQASDDYNKLTFIKFEVSILADRAKKAMRVPGDELQKPVSQPPEPLRPGPSYRENVGQ